MYTEVTTSSTFLSKYLPHKSTPPDKLSLFRTHLTDILSQKFAQHWYPSNPSRGNAFRSISCQIGRMDPLVVEAANRAGMSEGDLFFPNDLVLWTDPFCVSFKVGDHGQVVTVWEDKSGAAESSDSHKPLTYLPPTTTSPYQVPTPPPEKQASLLASQLATQTITSPTPAPGFYHHTRAPRSPSMRSTSSVMSQGSSAGSSTGTWSPPPSPPQRAGFRSVLVAN
ncbi:Protein btg1 [Rhizophlyctis rosea]|nr:Protein btg1 [Rhizophlyctis rosea]